MDPDAPASVISDIDEDDSEDDDIMLDGIGGINVGGLDSQVSPTALAMP
tara:strand:- start:3819 stop:3965 length:147 start_codon:yes stop_codon:yes gene_type:complete